MVKYVVKYWNNSINSKNLQFKNGLEIVYCTFFCFYCVDFKRKTQQKHNIAKLVAVFEWNLAPECNSQGIHCGLFHPGLVQLKCWYIS